MNNWLLMELAAFILGLTTGLGIGLWRYTQTRRQLRRLLLMFPSEASGNSLPLIPRLRSEMILQQQYQEELQQQLQTWQKLIQVAPLGYLQVDEENQLLWCNDMAQQLLGITRWEPGHIRLLLELVRSYELDQLIEQTRDQQQPEIREWVFHSAYTDKTAMGGVRSLSLRAYSWPLLAGEVGVFLENRQPLVELSQARDRWVTDLAHELRTPLTAIRLVVETLQESIEPPRRRWVERLLPEVDRLINLVQNWLELSQIEENLSQQLNYQNVEVRSLIHSVWQTLEPLTQLHQLNLTYSGPEDVWIEADESSLHRVFVNLFDNSIKHSPVKSSICVSVNLLPSVDSKQVQIDVIDSGSGFPESDLPYVFERLYRCEPSRTRQPNSLPSSQALSVSTGSGLGLAIVQQIILAHNGSVKAMNHPDTGGAWIQILLPKVAVADN